jgi:hypothetical protein
MIDYTKILEMHYAGSHWTLDGDYYDGLTWYSNTPKPTQAELDALWETTKAELAAKEQAKIAARQSALNKLMALGLTEEEALALGVK